MERWDYLVVMVLMDFLENQDRKANGEWTEPMVFQG